MPYFQLLSREVQDSQPWKEFHIRGLLSAFSVLFIRAESRRDDDSVRRFNSAQRSLVNRYILDNIHTELTVGGMSASLMLSRDYFSRVFRNTYGMPPRAYIKKERIRYATVRLTESNVSVKEAANELNYDNVNLFCRQFKDVTGLTPTQYRCKYPANVF
jgi:AraC-like DNA-binding protein